MVTGTNRVKAINTRGGKPNIDAVDELDMHSFEVRRDVPVLFVGLVYLSEEPNMSVMLGWVVFWTLLHRWVEY